MCWTPNEQKPNNSDKQYVVQKAAGFFIMERKINATRQQQVSPFEIFIKLISVALLLIRRQTEKDIAPASIIQNCELSHHWSLQILFNGNV